MLRISKPIMRATMIFNFILWFNVAFLTLETFPIIFFIISAICLAYEVSSNGK